MGRHSWSRCLSPFYQTRLNERNTQDEPHYLYKTLAGVFALTAATSSDTEPSHCMKRARLDRLAAAREKRKKTHENLVQKMTETSQKRVWDLETPRNIKPGKALPIVSTIKTRLTTVVEATAAHATAYKFEEYKPTLGHMPVSQCSHAKRQLQFLIAMAVHDEDEDEEKAMSKETDKEGAVFTRLRNTSSSASSSCTSSSRATLGRVLTLDKNVTLVTNNGRVGWPGHTFYRCMSFFAVPCCICFIVPLPPPSTNASLFL